MSRYGRTAVRIRGGFTPIPMGCRVDYHVEVIPWMLWALVASYAIGIPVLLGLIWFGYVPFSVPAWAIVITAFGLAINLWFSEQQARWLKDYVTSALHFQ